MVALTKPLGPPLLVPPRRGFLHFHGSRYEREEGEADPSSVMYIEDARTSHDLIIRGVHPSNLLCAEGYDRYIDGRSCCGAPSWPVRCGIDRSDDCANLDELGRHFGDPYYSGSDKHSGAHNFLRTYETLLEPYGLSARLLELGINRGNSLATWGHWFPHGQVVGVDRNLEMFHIHHPRHQLLGANRHHNLFVVERELGVSLEVDYRFMGDAMLLTAGYPFDVIVDDASHNVNKTRACFINFFLTILNPGGLYIIEDVAVDNETESQWKQYLRRLSSIGRSGPAHGLEQLIQQWLLRAVWLRTHLVLEKRREIMRDLSPRESTSAFEITFS